MNNPQIYNINGIWCGSCASAIEKDVQSKFGIKSSVDISTQTLIIPEKNTVSLTDLKNLLSDSGFAITEFNDYEAKKNALKLQEKKMFTRLAVIAFSTFWVMSLSVSTYWQIMGELTAESKSLINWMIIILSIPGLTYGGSFIYSMALNNFRSRRLSIDSLISLSIVICIGLSIGSLLYGEGELYIDSALMVLLIFSTIKFIKHKVFQRHVVSLYDLDKERFYQSKAITKAGDVVEKSNSQIKSGQRIILQAGDTLYFDGTIIDGSGYINLASSNGEQDPRKVKIGQNLPSGSILMSGDLTVKVEQPLGERQVDKSFRSTVERFHSSKALSEKGVAESLIKISIPVLIILSACFFVLQRLYFLSSFEQSLLSSLSVILIFCPCVLYLSKPLVVASLFKELKKIGILVRNPDIFHRLEDLTHLVFDKTGTLTGNDFEIELIENNSQFSNSQLWALIGGMESGVVHPIATAVSKKLWSLQIEPCDLESRSIQNKGVAAIKDGCKYFFGQAGFQMGINELDLCKNDQVVAKFRITDCLEAGSLNFLSAYSERAKIILLTGDNQENTEEFIESQNLKFDEVYSGKNILEKEQKLKEICCDGGKTLYIGDGENDIGAFKNAGVSVSLSNSAEKIKAVSDVTVLSVNQDSLIAIFKASKVFKDRIFQNYFLAVSYNALALYFALGSHLRPSGAILAMSISTILIIINSTRKMRLVL